MPDRFWDPQGVYQAGFLREYDNWVLEVSFRQHTLGSFIIFAKEHVERISELSDVAFLEFKNVLAQIESALTILPEFAPDRFNYLQMGNALHALHIHGIPRYASPRNFLNKTWHDTTWGHPPVWTTIEASNDLVIAIKQRLEQKI